MQIDEFESQFKSAIKEPYEYKPVRIDSCAIVTDYTGGEAVRLGEAARRLIPELGSGDYQSVDNLQWHLISGDKFNSVKTLLGIIEQIRPDILIVQRNLKTDPDDLVCGLSNYLDALTQTCKTPVLLLPELSLEELEEQIVEPLEVMVQTPHLVGDSSLINWGVRFALPNGRLYLVHIENMRVYKQYIDVIARIPEIDTAAATELIREKLLTLPTEFIEHAKQHLREKEPMLDVHGIAQLGHRIVDYRTLIEQHKIELVITYTQDEHLTAINTVAYSLAIAFRDVPILLL